MNAPTRYTCEDVFRRLDDFLDHELSDEESALVRAHLETCAQCASEHRFEATLLEAVRGKLQALQAPESLVRRVSEAIERERGCPP